MNSKEEYFESELRVCKRSTGFLPDTKTKNKASPRKLIIFHKAEIFHTPRRRDSSWKILVKEPVSINTKQFHEA